MNQQRSGQLNELKRTFQKKKFKWPKKTHEKMFTNSGHKGNANQITLRFHLTPVRLIINKNTTTNRCWQGCGNIGTLIHCWWECKLVKLLWKTILRLLKKQNIDLPYDPAISLLDIYPHECGSGYSRGTFTPIFIAAIFTIAKLWEQPRCPTAHEWIKKMWYLYTVEFY
jgi:hypothetical protein